MGVAGQILEHLLGSAKGRLGVDDPEGPNRLIKQALEGLAVGVLAQHAEETELSATKGLLQSSDELPAKDTTQNAHREEKVARTWIHCWPSAENPPAGTTQCRWG